MGSHRELTGRLRLASDRGCACLLGQHDLSQQGMDFFHEEKYRAMAIRVGDMLLETQSEDGIWNLFGGYHTDMTAEMEARSWCSLVFISLQKEPAHWKCFQENHFWTLFCWPGIQQ